ncbi:hypothetical protein GIB67_017966, partial [Kingdonia uniflora]
TLVVVEFWGGEEAVDCFWYLIDLVISYGVGMASKIHIFHRIVAGAVKAKNKLPFRDDLRENDISSEEVDAEVNGDGWGPYVPWIYEDEDSYDQEYTEFVKIHGTDCKDPAILAQYFDPIEYEKTELCGYDSTATKVFVLMETQILLLI